MWLAAGAARRCPTVWWPVGLLAGGVMQRVRSTCSSATATIMSPGVPRRWRPCGPCAALRHSKGRAVHATPTRLSSYSMSTCLPATPMTVPAVAPAHSSRPVLAPCRCRARPAAARIVAVAAQGTRHESVACARVRPLLLASMLSVAGRPCGRSSRSGAFLPPLATTLGPAAGVQDRARPGRPARGAGWGPDA